MQSCGHLETGWFGVLQAWEIRLGCHSAVTCIYEVADSILKSVSAWYQVRRTAFVAQICCQGALLIKTEWGVGLNFQKGPTWPWASSAERQWRWFPYSLLKILFAMTFFLRETSTPFILTQWLLGKKKNQRHVHVVVLGSPDFVLFYFSTILFPLISFNSNRLSFLLLGNVNFLLHLRLYQSTTTIFPAFLNQQTSFVYWKITNWVKHMPRGFSSVQVLDWCTSIDTSTGGVRAVNIR